MLVGHKTFYVKDGKEAYVGPAKFKIIKENTQETLKFYANRMKHILSQTEEFISYIIFFEDGKVGSGFLSEEMLDSLQILTEDEIMIKDIIE